MFSGFVFFFAFLYFAVKGKSSSGIWGILKQHYAWIASVRISKAYFCRLLLFFFCTFYFCSYSSYSLFYLRVAFMAFCWQLIFITPIRLSVNSCCMHVCVYGCHKRRVINVLNHINVIKWFSVIFLLTLLPFSLFLFSYFPFFFKSNKWQPT